MNEGTAKILPKKKIIGPIQPPTQLEMRGWGVYGSDENKSHGLLKHRRYT
jgi:hypothetical protein